LAVMYSSLHGKSNKKVTKLARNNG